MRGYSHLIIAGTTGYAISTSMQLSPIEGMVVGAVGGIICDIDEEHSLINSLLLKKVPYWLRSLSKIIIGIIGIFGIATINKGYISVPRNLLVGIIYIMAIFIISGISSIINQRNHRGILHDPVLGSLILITPLVFIFSNNLPLVYVFGAGLLTHYLTDPFNKSGLPFYLGGKYCRLRYPIRIKYDNQLAELIIVAACVCLIMFLKNFTIYKSMLDVII